LTFTRLGEGGEDHRDLHGRVGGGRIIRATITKGLLGIRLKDEANEDRGLRYENLKIKALELIMA